MQTVSSYGVELRKQNIPVRQTLEIYRSAVCYLTEIYEQVWEELAEIPDAKRRFNAAEHLVHTTKKNPARFDFDLRFPKMPSYLRRAAIQHALGSVSSYETRMDLWEKSGEKAGKPRLAYENHAMPVFYYKFPRLICPVHCPDSTYSSGHSPHCICGSHARDSKYHCSYRFLSSSQIRL